MAGVTIQKVFEALPRRILNKARVITPRRGDVKEIQGFPYMTMARVPWTPLLELLVDLKLFLVLFVSSVDFECDILITSICFCGSAFDEDKTSCPDLLQITGEPYGGSSPKTKFTNYLVPGTQYVTDISGIVFPLFKLLKPFLVEHFRGSNSLKAASRKMDKR